VKLVRVRKAGGHSSEAFTFHFEPYEKDLLQQVMRLYPLLDASYHRLASSTKDTKLDAAQHLLDEAMQQQIAEGRLQVRAMLEPKRWTQDKFGGCEFTLPAGETELFLQVLNNVRVGAWVALGKPEEDQRHNFSPMTEQGQLAMVMELCGFFQMALLHALREPSEGTA
jgi:hypothetical protein